MDDDLKLRTSRMAPAGQDALRTLLEETRTVLARTQRRNERSEEKLAAITKQIITLWAAVAVLGGGLVVVAIYALTISRK